VSFLVFSVADAKPVISIEKARAIALAKARGSITSAEYEKEHGKWLYSFDIRGDERQITDDRQITEVHVDAGTSAILSVEIEHRGKNVPRTWCGEPMWYEVTVPVGETFPVAPEETLKAGMPQRDRQRL